MTTWTIRVVLIVSTLLFLGCVHVVSEPALPLPTRPAWHFFVCDTDKICLTQADADLLNKWLDKLSAFEASRQRVIETTK